MRRKSKVGRKGKSKDGYKKQKQARKILWRERGKVEFIWHVILRCEEAGRDGN